MNLAEFPIAALADRVPDGQTTLVFEDRLEPHDSEPIVRRLTIMGTHKHGLPTSLDDEVLVGLIQLTKRRNGFSDPKVAFSRYELIELLGWPQSGPSYRRIEEAMQRWISVVLMYENAWWDNAAKSWVDENFHVLDNVTIYDREKRRPASKAGKPAAGRSRRGKKGEGAGTEPLPLSSFRWNEVIFQSFRSGNLKQLDLEFYLRLRLPTTKRMFRFLDKRFYRRDRLDFDLKTLACEHIGLSRSYPPTELKRRLRPALEELEALGFLEPLSAEERYSYIARGQWRIILIRARPSSTAPAPAEEVPALVEALTARGVTPKAAAKLVEGHPAGRIQTKLEVFDWLVRNNDKRVGKNAAGYLVASIREDYQPPVDFKKPAAAKAAGDEAVKPDGDAAEARRAAEEARWKRRDKAAADAARQADLRARWEALPEDHRQEIIELAKAANPGLRRWKSMLELICLAEMERRQEASPGRDLAPATPREVQQGLFDAGPKGGKRS